MVKAAVQKDAEADRESIDLDEIPNSVIEHLIDEWIHSDPQTQDHRRNLL